jgi:VWFA-related protein
MPIRRAAIVAALLLAGSGTAAVRSQSPAAARADQAYTSGATAILVDVVVRDRRGRPVMDLAAGDFEVYEDGVNQKVDTFTRVSRGGGIGVGVAWKAGGATTSVMTSRPVPESAAETPPGDDTTVALVFDHLSSESLRLAQRATLDYVPMTGNAEVRVGVFATDPGFRVIQPYTTDRTVIRSAVAKVTPSGTASEDDKGERAELLQARRRELATQNAAATSAAGGIGGAALARNSSEIGARESELHMVQTELNMLRSFENLDRDHRGYGTSGALLGVVESLAMLPGRKTIVFFSEGLPVSPALAARLDAVIDAANRANVTTYAIDAHGLRTKTSATTLKKEMDGFVEDRFSQLSSGSDRTNQPLTMAFERVEDTLNLDSRTGLAKLAQDTGGFLVENSNDLSSALKRIDEDNQFHYLLTYSPRNATFDGKFRAIRVKVRRPSTQVFARRGYRAIRSTGAADTASFEAPALAMLDGGRLPNAFPVHAGSFSFPDPSRRGLTPLLVHVRTDALRFAVDEGRSTYSSQAAIVVRVRNGSGQDVQKLSQRYQLSGDARDVDAARQGDIIFYREVDLEPGVYTIESVVFDAGTRRGSARVTTLNVPAVDGRDPAMSSLVLVNRIEETSDATQTDSPLRPPLFVGRMLLYPNLGEPVSKAAVTELPFYFTLYGNVADANVTAQLVRNGQPLAEAPVPLPDSTGARVQHIGRLPIGGLPVGTYELRIGVKTGNQQLSRTAFFTIVE